MTPGDPRSWSMHPCKEGEWSNDEDEYKEAEAEALVVPCRPPSKTRPTGGAGAGAGADGGGESLVVDGRPGGFRPGAGIVSATSAGASSSSSSSGSTISAAAMAVAVSAAVVAVLAAAFLVVRKRRRNGNGGSDEAKLIYLDDPSSSSSSKVRGTAAAAASAGGGGGTANNSFESECNNDSPRDLRGIEADGIETDIGTILADIESGFASRLAVGTADDSNEGAPHFSPSAWNGANGAIELDPEAAAAYLAGAGATSSTGTLSPTATATSTSTTTATSKSGVGRTRSAATAASATTTASTTAAVIATTATTNVLREVSIITEEDDPDKLDVSLQGSEDKGSFVSANLKDIGRRHSAQHVCECNSSTCIGCDEHQEGRSIKVGKVDFIRVYTEDK